MAKKKTSRSSDKTPSFEQALAQVEQIIEGIESGEVGLEESLDQYEKGVAMLRHCRSILDRAEEKIQRLKLDASGELTEDDEA